MTEAWLGALVFGLLFVSPVLLLLGVRRLVSAGGRTTRREVLPAAYEAAVWRSLRRSPGQCRACGAHNGPGFKYCRQCQAELE